jgi:hypothetical protein
MKKKPELADTIPPSPQPGQDYEYYNIRRHTDGLWVVVKAVTPDPGEILTSSDNKSNTLQKFMRYCA